MDGTIEDKIPFHHEAWLTFHKRYGVEVSPEHFAAQNYGTKSEMMVRFFGDYLSTEELVRRAH